MKNERQKIKGLCFGEVLWDNLPSGKKLGGAPLNVAYHLNKIGVPTSAVSRVGSDSNGQELIARCGELGIPTDLFQVDKDHATSTVEVHIDQHNDVTYEIVFPVAWDFIEVTPEQTHAAQEADFFVFGSLCSRAVDSFQTLKKLLSLARFKVFDVNLRAPFYTKQRVLELLGYADLVKMNKDELTIIARWLAIPLTDTDSTIVECVMVQFQIDEILVTYGAAGAVYHAQQPRISYHFAAYPVQVKDTIGSGDSFLAAFLSKRMSGCKGERIEEMMGFAATLSAFVTQSSGACPDYDERVLHRFQWIQYLARGEVSLY